MCDAPFREFGSFIVLNGNADLPQHLLVALADRRSQGGYRLRGVEIEDKARFDLFCKNVRNGFEREQGRKLLNQAANTIFKQIQTSFFK